MKILYGIQGTGNGHISRAMEILPALQRQAEVDILISGVHSELKLSFEVRYPRHGLGFVFGKKGGIDLLETYKKSHLKKFYREVRDLDLKYYDMIISDFEPVTAWAAMQQHRVCVGLSNQVSLLSPKVPKAGKEDLVGRFIIRNYAPCSLNFGLSYERYDERIYTPVIRQSLREAPISDAGHFTVYLPSYSDEKIVSVLSQVPHANWQVFSKYAKAPMELGNVQLQPLNKERFEQSVTSAHGILTAAGFGTTTEALFMGKKLLVIPQKNQYEQACNAAALRGMGVHVIKSLKAKRVEKIRHWVDNAQPVKKDYPDICDEMVSEIISSYHLADDHYVDYLTLDQYSLKKV